MVTVNQKKPPKNVVAKTKMELRTLCLKAQQAAENAQDHRAQAFREALTKNREKETLRAFGIVCEADILRVFFKPQT